MFQSNEFNNLHLTSFIMVFRCIEIGIFINIKCKKNHLKRQIHTLGIET